MVSQQLFKAMTELSSLVHLNFSANLFTTKAVDDFAAMIQHNNGLEYLNISRCFTEENDSETHTKALVNLKSLQYFDFSNNAINITTADNIAAIISNNPYLEHLNLSKCNIIKIALLSILKALQNNGHLKFLNLNSNPVDNEEATKLATVISNNPFLEKVELSNCYLQEIGMKSILLSLKDHTSLKHFDISSNKITNHIANELADVINITDGNTHLTHLNISDSEIQEYGLLKVFKAAKRIKTLECIQLCNCIISDRAAHAIADAISVNCMMKELVFANNDFQEQGIKMLLFTLKEIHMLTSLTVTCNNIISEISPEISEIVSNNCITYLNLSNCNLQKSNCAIILNALLSQPPIL